MAQTGSAQREPSMEEILASIRRIIEDSDTARRPLEEENGSPELSAAPLAAPEVQHPEIQHEVEAFRAELDDAAAVQPAVSRRHEPVAAEPVHSSSPEPAVNSDPHESLDPREDEAPQAPTVPIFEEHLREPVAHLRPVTPASVEAAPAETASTEIRPSPSVSMRSKCCCERSARWSAPLGQSPGPAKATVDSPVSATRPRAAATSTDARPPGGRDSDSPRRDAAAGVAEDAAEDAAEVEE